VDPSSSFSCIADEDSEVVSFCVSADTICDGDELMDIEAGENDLQMAISAGR
jgi:hypothetical protein